jgi:hypothetical protein
MLKLTSLGTRNQVHLLAEVDTNGKSHIVNTRCCPMDCSTVNLI